MTISSNSSKWSENEVTESPPVPPPVVYPYSDGEIDLDSDEPLPACPLREGDDECEACQ